MADLGDIIPLSIEIRDDTGVLVNASTVTLSVVQPDGAVITPFVQNPPTVTGQYIADLIPTIPGRYTVRWVSTGPAAAFVDAFDVRPAQTASILSLNQAKEHLNMSLTSGKDDEELRQWIEITTEVVERHRGEVIARRQFTEQLRTRYARAIALNNRPVISVDAISVANGAVVQTIDPLGWYLDGPLGVIKGTGLSGDVTITYTAGYRVVPARYIGAAKIILAHLWSTQRVPTLGPTPTLRGGNREEAIITTGGEGYAIPHRAVELLGGRPSMIV
jgi:hypothetical protein